MTRNVRFTLVAALMAAASSVDAASTFTDSGQNLGNNNEIRNAVELADFDGDGDLDAVVVGTATEVWINQGGGQSGVAGTFAGNGQALVPDLPLAVATDDLDGDGDVDLVTLQSFANGIQIWINQGGDQGGTAGQFTANPTKFGNADGTALALGAIDANASPDLFVMRSFLNFGASPDDVWWNDGDGQFSNSMQAVGAANSRDVALGDMNGDGALDAFIGAGMGNLVWINDGAGAFTDSGQLLGSGFTRSVVLIDLDDDGDLDAVTGENGGDIHVWINHGPGSPGQFADSGHSLNTGHTVVYDVALGDLDGDGDPDLVAGVNGTTKVYENGGEGEFTDTGLALGVNVASQGVALGDLDGDGDLDAFVANSGGAAANRVWFNTSPPPPTGPIEFIGSTAPLLYTNGIMRLFPDVVISTNQPVDWGGATLTIQIATNYGSAADTLLIEETDGLTLTRPSSGGLLSLNGVGIGTFPLEDFLPSHSSDTGVVTFNSNAGTAAVALVLQHLGFDFFDPRIGTVYDALARDPLHVEPARSVRLSLSFGAGGESTLTKSVAFDHTVGIRIAPHFLVMEDESVDGSGTYREFGLYGISKAGISFGLSKASARDSAIWSLSGSEHFSFLGAELLQFTASPDLISGVGACLACRWGPFEDKATIVGLREAAVCGGTLLVSVGDAVTACENAIRPAGALSSLSLPPFHALEQLMIQTPGGRRLAGLYWQHTAEVVEILFADPELIPEMIALMTDFQPGVARLLRGTGDEFEITQEMIDRLNAVWNQVISHAGPELSQALQDERAAFRGFQEFVGKDFNQWAQMLGVAVPSEPFIFISQTRRQNGQLTIEANAVEGHILSLWRSLSLAPIDWQPVPGAAIVEEGYSATFTDPAPPAGQAYYQVRATADGATSGLRQPATSPVRRQWWASSWP